MKQNFLVDQKIKNEKRRRNQAYISLDYFLSVLTYFDFFSFDAFKITKHSKYLANIYNQEQVSSEFFLVAFLYSSTNAYTFLKKFGLDEDFLSQFCLGPKIAQSNFINSFWSRKNLLEWNLLSFEKNENQIEFSQEVNFIFEKAAENALTRFKSPIVTSDILFITLMEEKKTKASKILKKILKNETNWYLFRYKLIKHIHFQEANVRGEVPKNQRYFAYLLKTQLGELDFETLIKNESLVSAVSLFRNCLISNVLKQDLFSSLSKEINKSIKLTQSRNYSS
jgi:hypothetical protein